MLLCSPKLVVDKCRREELSLDRKSQNLSEVVSVQIGNMNQRVPGFFICISLQTNPPIVWSGKSSLPMNILFSKGFQMFILSFRDGWVTVQLGIHIRKSADSHANVLILNNFYTKFYVGVDVISYT